MNVKRFWTKRCWFIGVGVGARVGWARTKRKYRRTACRLAEWGSILSLTLMHSASVGWAQVRHWIITASAFFSSVVMKPLRMRKKQWMRIYFLQLMLVLRMLSAYHLRFHILSRLDGAYRSFCKWRMKWIATLWTFMRSAVNSFGRLATMLR